MLSQWSNWRSYLDIATVTVEIGRAAERVRHELAAEIDCGRQYAEHYWECEAEEANPEQNEAGEIEQVSAVYFIAEGDQQYSQKH